MSGNEEINSEDVTPEQLEILRIQLKRAAILRITSEFIKENADVIRIRAEKLLQSGWMPDES